MLNIKNHNRLMPGLVDSAVEFFVHENEVHCLTSGQVYTYDNFPQRVIDPIQADMLKHPEALKALAQWENLTESEFTRQYIYCRHGGVDDQPDIDVNGNINNTEYFDCGLRGTCKYEGKLCNSIKVENGYLTKTEIKILQLISEADKVIADTLCISQETVNSHTQNIRRKTGMNTKVELAILATKKGII